MNIFKRVYLIENPYAYSVGDKVGVFPTAEIGIITERKVMIDFPSFRLKKYYTVINKQGKSLKKESYIISVFENVFDIDKKPTINKLQKEHVDALKKVGVSFDNLKKNLSSIKTNK